jgi:hypothetical protein
VSVEELVVPLATELDTASTALTPPANAAVGTATNAAVMAAATKIRMLRADMSYLPGWGQSCIQGTTGSRYVKRDFVQTLATS